MSVSKKSKRVAAVILIGALPVLAACSSSSSSSGSAAATASGSAMASSSAGQATTADTIVIKNFMFAPMSITVAPGTMVTVHNEDSVTHTLTDKSDAKLFSTGDISPGQSKTFKAPNKAGSYGFICTIHQYMSGTIVVR